MKSTQQSFNEDLSRRNFVSGMAKTCLGTMFLSQAGWLKAAEATGAKLNGKAKKVIYLYMEGGMSHIDTLDPKAGDVQGPGKPIGTKVSGIQLTEFLPLTAKVFDKVAVVRSLWSKEGDHRRAKYQLHMSYPPLSSVAHPSLGSWVVKEGGKLNKDLPGYFAVGNTTFNSGFFENEYDPFRIGDPGNALLNVLPPKSVGMEKLDKRLGLMNKLNEGFQHDYDGWEPVKDYTTFYDRALTMMKSKDLDAFDLTQESEDTRARYGKNNFGQGVLLARRLVQRGVRYVEVSLGNWDTHTEMSTRIPDLAGKLDAAYSSLIADLTRTGEISETLVVVASEFGREPKIVTGDGRGHHPRAFSAMLAGGGIRGGQAYGSTDATGDSVKDNPVTMMDLNATIATCLGLDPKTETISPVGRPFLLAGGGKPIDALI
jgi:hypothetical protein